MSKQVKAKAKSGQEVWMIVPNIGVYSFATNKDRVTFLEIFYFLPEHGDDFHPSELVERLTESDFN